jgi:redox-sensitive bicupin YhaK (pirin superfamily)
MERTIVERVKGFRTEDGAGVSLVRVLGNETAKAFDPILMLDSFDSTNPDDYTAGFPMHPHRGIETISYIYRGKMVHVDSLGNRDAISDGQMQWMTAGSGILHEEQIPPAERLLGVQLWLNLPSKDKMAPPAYHSIKDDEIKEIPFEGGTLRLLAGSYGEERGHQGKYLPLDYYDIHLDPNASFPVGTKERRSAMAFTLLGEAVVAGENVREKTAVKFSEGNFVTIKSGKDPVQILFMSSVKLDEQIVWGGPIVMNSRAELDEAFSDLHRGTFLKQKMSYDTK